MWGVDVLKKPYVFGGNQNPMRSTNCFPLLYIRFIRILYIYIGGKGQKTLGYDSMKCGSGFWRCGVREKMWS